MLQRIITTLGIIDSDPMICEGFGVIMHKLSSNFKSIFMANNYEDLKVQSKTDIELPFIMLLTLSNPIDNCLESLNWLQETNPDINVVGFSNEYPEGSQYIMAKAGCVGFLYKNDNLEVYQKAIQDIVDHGAFVNSRSNLIKVLRTPFTDEKPTVKDLILIKLVCTHKTYIDIGLILCISPKTVEDHVFKLCDKLNAHNRHGLMCMAFQRKWVA